MVKKAATARLGQVSSYRHIIFYLVPHKQAYEQASQRREITRAQSIHQDSPRFIQTNWETKRC